MNTKSIVQLAVVFVLAVIAGHFYEQIPKFHEKSEQETMDIILMQHRIRNLSIYEPIREQDISIIEYWERKPSWYSDDIVLMIAWRSEPSYQVSLENVEIIPSENDSSIASIEYGDDAYDFQPNLSNSFGKIQRIGGSLDSNAEEEIIQQTYILLEEYIEFKYSDQDLLDDAMEMTDKMLSILIETITNNKVTIERSGREF